MNLSKLIGDYRAFYHEQCNKLAELGIKVDDVPVSHLAFTCESNQEYLALREALENMCLANVENVWNGRPISKILLAKPESLSSQTDFSLLELIPPGDDSDGKSGLDHVGILLADDFDEFTQTHQSVFRKYSTNDSISAPALIRFADGSKVKFYRESLQALCQMDGHVFDGIHHENDWLWEGSEHN